VFPKGEAKCDGQAVSHPTEFTKSGEKKSQKQTEYENKVKQYKEEKAKYQEESKKLEKEYSQAEKALLYIA